MYIILSKHFENIGIKKPRANPTIVSYLPMYNTRAVSIYNATSSLVRFEKKSSTLKKRLSLLPTYIKLALYVIE
jgi:hypothetical protein